MPKKSTVSPDDADAAYKTLSKYLPTERGNATLMASAWRGRLRYDAVADIWLRRSVASGVWREDASQSQALQAVHNATEARRGFALQIPDNHKDLKYLDARKKHLAWAFESEKYRVAHASVQWAQTMPDFAIDPMIWDRDPLALGTPTGIYDLRTGEARPPDSESYVSKVASVTPADSPLCPLWEDFLGKAMKGDTDKIAYLKRLAGYSLTGSTREQSLTWFVGGGGNGKGTFLDALTAIYGDYAHPMRTEPLLASKHDVHPTELCDLKGRRLIIASETDEDRTWRGALLKKLTGSDPITARRVHRDSITFLPTHTLIISCNSYPSLSSVGEAERRRFQIVEWSVTFRFLDDKSFQEGDEIRDPQFNQKLEAEYPGILRWAMDGARDWLEKGLNPPDSVIASSQAYMDDQDVLQQWINERVVRDPTAWTPSLALWESWHAWAVMHGLWPGKGIQGFIPKINRKGFICAMQGIRRERGIAGLRLRSDDELSVNLPLPLQ